MGGYYLVDRYVTTNPFALALPLSDPIYILLGLDLDFIFVSMIVSILFPPRNLALRTESNVVLDWSSFVSDGLWVVPCCIFCFLSYVSTSAVDLAFERLSAYHRR